MPAVLKFEMILSELLIRNNYSGFILIKSKINILRKIISLNKIVQYYILMILLVKMIYENHKKI